MYNWLYFIIYVIIIILFSSNCVANVDRYILKFPLVLHYNPFYILYGNHNIMHYFKINKFILF